MSLETSNKWQLSMSDIDPEYKAYINFFILKNALAGARTSSVFLRSKAVVTYVLAVWFQHTPLVQCCI